MANKLYISDELLAAYLEGNTNKAETLKVLNALKSDPVLQETLDIALKIEDNTPQWSAVNDQPDTMLQIAAESGRNLCDLQCEAFVLKQCGINNTIDELLEIAKENHWIQRAGTPLQYMGNLLEYKGLSVIRKYGATMEDLKEALQAGYGIIVAVDRDKLYPELPDEEDATNHAIIVTGIASDSVQIYDPHDCVQVSILDSQFGKAWKESRCYMVSVNPPEI